jgi:hypothetical protein
MTRLRRDNCVVTVVPTSDRAVEITAELGDRKLQRTVPAHLSRSDSLQFFRIIQAMKTELCAERDRHLTMPERRTGRVQPENFGSRI